MKESRNKKNLEISNSKTMKFHFLLILDTGQLKSPIPINTSNVFCPHSDTFSCSCGVPVTDC